MRSPGLRFALFGPRDHDKRGKLDIPSHESQTLPSSQRPSIVIDLYTWTTPSGRRASIALEEIGIHYEAHAVDIGKDEQFKPEFLKIAPNNRIPAIVDRDSNFSLMESGAILLYLAEKAGKLLPTDTLKRYRVIEWLMWQMGGP